MSSTALESPGKQVAAAREGSDGDGGTGKGEAELQEGSQSQPQEGTEPESQEESGGKGDGELARARKEAASYRKQLRETETRLKTLEDAKLSGQEKVANELQTTSTERDALSDEVRSLKVQLAAGKVGINPDLVDTVPGLLGDDAFEDDKSLEKALKQLVKDRPALAGQTGKGVDQGESGGEGGGAGADDMNARIRRAAGRA